MISVSGSPSNLIGIIWAMTQTLFFLTPPHPETKLLSQPERFQASLTDSLRQIKETLGQFLTGLPSGVFFRE